MAEAPFGDAQPRAARIAPSDITGLVLAGGQGQRMGGVDKGLQDFHGQPLARHALARLASQVGARLLSANRNLAAYQAFGVPVVSDELPGFAGPLAGIAAAWTELRTPWLLTVPCDGPYFPLDLGRRLADAALREDSALAVACRTDAEGRRRWEPAYLLIHASLAPDLAAALAAGERKLSAWIGRHRVAEADFSREADARAFANINTRSELEALSGERDASPSAKPSAAPRA